MAMMNPGAGMMAPNPMQNNESMGAPMEAPMAQVKGLNITAEQFNQAMNGLEQNEIASLDQHLTPPVKMALGKLLGQEVLQVIEPLGPNEPTVSLPVSVVASAYPADNIEESIAMMQKDIASKGTNDIPSSPTGGLGGPPATPAEDPTTNVPPSMPMMAQKHTRATLPIRHPTQLRRILWLTKQKMQQRLLKKK